MSATRIRLETPQDVPVIRSINERVFHVSAEAAIVDKLREGCPETVSLVAERDGRVIGYVLFSPVMIDGRDRCVQGMGLAPIAVLPEYQRRGVGSELIRRGLEMLRGCVWPFVIVLGHPDFYRRFGFGPAARYGISSAWKGVPDAAFMILILNQDAMQGVTGVARYRDEFDEAV
jgi:putative acetyltransferase